jgi:hypothetical protein
MRRSDFHAFVLIAVIAKVAHAQYLPIYGGPTLDQEKGTGFVASGNYPTVIREFSIIIGSAYKFGSNQPLGYRAIRWDPSGLAPIELPNLGTSPAGFATSFAISMNAAGIVVGSSHTYVGSTDLSQRAVRWDSGHSLTELGGLGTDPNGSSSATAAGINDAGVITGYANKYVGGTYMGTRAVRWDVGGTLATELGVLGTNSDGYTDAYAGPINAAGLISGNVEKYVGGVSVGHRAVRWNPGETAAIELGNLGTNSNGFTSGTPAGMNASGTVVGQTYKFSGNVNLGWRAVRWNAGGTTATELGTLGTDNSGVTNTYAFAVNSGGTVVGYGYKYSAGVSQGMRAIRWDAGGTSATELGKLGAGSNRTAVAIDVNDSGLAVGYVDQIEGGVDLGERAVLWGMDGATIDLNALIDPDSGWTLTRAMQITNDNYIGGLGLFDADGSGPLSAYERAFVLDARSIPEPAISTVLAGIGALFWCRRGPPRR